MQAVKEITLEVNEKNLMKSLRFAFTTKTTLFKELMQNGDRAGASEIRIALESDGDNTMVAVIEDNGCGIDDLSLLLSVAVSGWSDEVMQHRSPYGLGFLAALYATESIEVESRGFKAAFDSQAAQAFQPVLVEPHAESANKPGTRLVLHGLKLGLGEARGAIQRFAKGFPAQVILDGAEVERCYALDAADRIFVQTPIGLVSMPCLETGYTHESTVCYLQGFFIYSSSSHFDGRSPTVIHLDPGKFAARMPDRDVLVDQHDRVKEIEKVLSSLWRETLIRKKAEMPAAEFLDRYHVAIQMYGEELANDIPLLSRHNVEVFTEMPFMTHDWDDFTGHPKEHITKEDVESGRVLLVGIEDGIEDDVSAWNYAWRCKAVVVPSYLHDGHWANPYVRRIASMKTDAVIRGEYARGRMSGAYVYSEVVLCEDFVLKAEDEDGNSLDEHVINDEIMFAGDVFLVPRNAQSSGWAVRQVSNFENEHDEFLEDKQDADDTELLRKIQELRGLPPAEVLQGLIAEHYWKLENYPSLIGKTFTIAVDIDGKFEVAEFSLKQ